MSLPPDMAAITVPHPGGPEAMRLVRLPVPRPGRGEILIRVEFAGVNRADLLQREGGYDPPPGASPLLGLECAGTVVALGAGVTRWREGDRVCALLSGGGYAGHALCHETHALPVPGALDMARASCLPEACFTVWSHVVMRGRLGAGERFLVHGGTSGIGTTAIQIARNLGARVFATAGSAQKCAACQELGAEYAINYRTEDFVARMRAEGGADVILDIVGGDYLDRNLRALAMDGRLIQIACMAGARARINLVPLMARRLSVMGVTLRPQDDAAKARIAGALLRHVWPMIERGALNPVLDSTFPLAEAAKAHERLASSAHVGKIVLRVDH